MSLRPLLARLITVLALLLAGAGMAAAQSTREADALSRALTEMRAGDWEAARASARGAGPIGADIIEWHYLRGARGTFDEAVAFLARRPDWPGLAYLRERSEAAVPFGTRSAEVLAFFAETPPQTGSGSSALTAAYLAEGRAAEAEAQAVLAWRTQILSAADEDVLLSRFGGVLAPHHTERLDMLLWRDQRPGAERMYPRVDEGWRALGRARLALRADQPGVDTLIAAIPASHADDPGLAYERMQWRVRKGRTDDAIALMIDRDGTVADLGNPEAWSNWRRVLARSAMRSGEARTAYRLAARHGLTEGSNYADLEWLAGYVALRYLDDPEAALGHFQRFRLAVETPISLGRAGYWEGRAHAAMGNAEMAQAAYAFGGEFQTSFYGLLAAEAAGLPMDPALTGTTDYGDWRTSSFAESSVLAAGLLLQKAGERSLAERFLTHLAESLDESGVGQLAALAFELEEPHIALMIAKRAADAGIVVPAAYYPVVDLGAANPIVPPELALSIARRESEFDPGVVSGVGARGLMQLMPGTAEEMAGDLGLPYSANRLLSDPAYNATLGVAYLAELISEFGGNFVLVSAAYNAGPSRPRRWIQERGDPRAAGTDVIDWIEHIPFDETRNYVMRVTESLPVYRARLTGRTEPLRLSQELQGR
ncbi:transglycosylase SLT domain-containing protein [Palleronia sp. KMU-117]|uniref:lytic transglycosylase domain-containing protein n=1 Tax=Palleronia sp. KMU-117 TaxID=3434108 RepID=UPI003D7202E6